MSDAKTTEQHELEGTDRPDRHEQPVTLTIRDVEAPENLTAEQVEIWNELSEEFTPDLVDLAMLETVVIQIDRARQASKEIEKRGFFITINDGKTDTVNPAIKVERDSQALAIKLLNQLRSKYGAKSAKRETKKSPRLQAAEHFKTDPSET